VLLTTFRKNGTPVATPVWAVRKADELWIWTNPDAGKVKRIRRDPAVRIQPCGVRGAPIGDPVPGHGRMVPAAEVEGVWGLLIAKYGWQARMSRLGDRFNRLFRRDTSPLAVLAVRLG
jgi:uncharacterized protein